MDETILRLVSTPLVNIYENGIYTYTWTCTFTYICILHIYIYIYMCMYTCIYVLNCESWWRISSSDLSALPSWITINRLTFQNSSCGIRRQKLRNRHDRKQVALCHCLSSMAIYYCIEVFECICVNNSIVIVVLLILTTLMISILYHDYLSLTYIH